MVIFWHKMYHHIEMSHNILFLSDELKGIREMELPTEGADGAEGAEREPKLWDENMIRNH